MFQVAMAFGDSHFTAAATLLQCGPPLVLFCCIIAPRSLLIIVALTRYVNVASVATVLWAWAPTADLNLTIVLCAAHLCGHRPCCWYQPCCKVS